MSAESTAVSAPERADVQPRRSSPRVRRPVRSAFISDTHLASRGCRAREVLGFLDGLNCESLYIVGDFIDCWRLRGKVYFPSSHMEVVMRVLGMVGRGTQVTYLPGNHDALAHDYAGQELGGVTVSSEVVHRTADGRRLLVVHGDAFDPIEQHAPLASKIGAAANEHFLHRANAAVNQWREMRGKPSVSLLGELRANTKRVTGTLREFENDATAFATDSGYDGIVCGHAHAPAALHGEVGYYNCGDWIDSCTALVEDFDGELRLVRALS